MTALERLAEPLKRISAGFFGMTLALICAGTSELVLVGFLPETQPLGSIGRILLVFLIIVVIHRFAAVSLRQYQPDIKDLTTLSVVLIASLLVASFGRLIGYSVLAYAAQINAPRISDIARIVDPQSLFFAIPYAAGGILAQLIMGMQYGLIFGLTLALIIGIYSADQVMIPACIVMTTLVGCYSMAKFRSRRAYVKAGLAVATIGLPLALISILLDPQVDSVDVAVRLIAPLLSGLLCSLLVGGLIPVLEYVGGYVTDMTLLEIATLDHPLLKDLSLQAPGTWNHSMVMGMMAETAADSIGANPVVSRVGAYFHDIGKTKNPLYFVENQDRGENRHDKLSSSMSALIIRSHVKDGIKLARQHRLPKVIEDMIPQHHGTALIEYFYDKASREAEEAGESQEVDKSLYQYPGPKPQTKEAGILMLADGIEAATRTLAEPNLDRIQGLVQKMINKVFASGELDECELTLKDLHSIAKSFTHVLNGIYHQRIAYSEPAEKVREPAEVEFAESDRSLSATREEEVSVEEQPKKEDLKRLGCD